MLSNFNKKNNKNLDPGFELGQTVKVKKGVMCPDYDDLCLEDYQGIVTDFSEDEAGEMTICIEWDAISLKNLPEKFVKESIKENLAFQLMYLSPDEIESSEPRSTEEEMMEVQDEIDEKYKWSDYEKIEPIILEALNGIDSNDEVKVLEAWKTYLEKKLVFPFQTEIAEFQQKGKLRMGDILKLLNINFLDDKYGLIGETKKGNNKYSMPICDLKATDENSENYMYLDAYSIWFANK